jgi:hypothetical protein
MGRLIEAPPRHKSGGLHESVPGAGPAQGGAGDNFLDRVVKYIPGEVLATYLALDRALIGDATALKLRLKETNAEKLLWADMSWTQTTDYYLPVVLFVGLFLLTPVYFWRYAAYTDPSAPWRLQGTFAALAFAVWAYSIRGGAFEMFDQVYNPKYAMIAIVLFTLASGFFPTEARKEDDDPQHAGTRAQAVKVASITLAAAQATPTPARAAKSTVAASAANPRPAEAAGARDSGGQPSGVL